MTGKVKWRIILFFLLYIIIMPVCAEAAENEDSSLEGLLDEVDFSELDELTQMDLMPEGAEGISFSEIVEGLLTDGIGGFDYSLVLKWAKDALFSELSNSKKILVEVVVLAVGFSILRNFSGAFRSAYISNLCFLLVYCVLAVMLLDSFLSFRDIVAGALNHSVDFMKALVPAFCVTMIFSAGPGTSLGFYQTAFLVIYLIQWLFLKVLVPFIHVYVILELFNHFFEDEKFMNLTELIRGVICWSMKIAGACVLGLNVVQGLISPAKDRLMSGTVSKAAAVIPGIGNAVSGVSEMLLGSGIMIKNCVGAAALVMLVAIGMVPMLKILAMSLFYKLAAVAVEPVADKRIAGCLKGLAEGGVLYLKLAVYCLVLFFLTIALTTAASSFIY